MWIFSDNSVRRRPLCRGARVAAHSLPSVTSTNPQIKFSVGLVFKQFVSHCVSVSHDWSCFVFALAASRCASSSASSWTRAIRLCLAHPQSFPLPPLPRHLHPPGQPESGLGERVHDRTLTMDRKCSPCASVLAAPAARVAHLLGHVVRLCRRPCALTAWRPLLE